MKWNFVAFCLLTFNFFTASPRSHAEVLISRDIIGATENAVVMPDGRYFVAGDKGIFEIKRAVDTSANCTYDSLSGLTACLQVAKARTSWTSFFSGMTSDGEYLYAAYTEWNPLKLLFGRPNTAAIYKVLPGGSEAAQIQIQPLDSPKWYNGMVMLNKNTLLLSVSQSGTALNFAGAAIEKLVVTDPIHWQFELSEWLPTGPGMLLPNGLVSDDGGVYFVGGQSLFKVTLNTDGNAGEIARLYKTGPLHFMDDLTLNGDTLAVAQFSPINGLVKNTIVLLDKNSGAVIEKIPTNKVQLSSLAIDKGLLGNSGDLIGTSFFSGGVHLFPTPVPSTDQPSSRL